jgi:hypothetical protein
MDATEFDRLIARVRNPRLIPGIYNYCDGRCPRCPFTERCLLFVENAEAASSRAPADMVDASLERTIELLAEIARREGVDLSAIDGDGPPADRDSDLPHEHDPLVVRARDYGALAWRVARAIAPMVAARGDRTAIDAVETIEWFSTRIAPKVYRAVCGQADAPGCDGATQPDCDGSAKVAIIGIRESRAAWLTLMRSGQAAADGVPAKAAPMLEQLDADLAERFPRAEQFVRPGFDEPAVAAGAPATLPPWAQRTPPAAT